MALHLTCDLLRPREKEGKKEKEKKQTGTECNLPDAVGWAGRLPGAPVVFAGYEKSNGVSWQAEQLTALSV